MWFSLVKTFHHAYFASRNIWIFGFVAAFPDLFMFYPLVIEHTCRKWPFVVVFFPLKRGIFHSQVNLPEGTLSFIPPSWHRWHDDFHSQVVRRLADVGPKLFPGGYIRHL